MLHATRYEPMEGDSDYGDEIFVRLKPFKGKKGRCPSCRYSIMKSKCPGTGIMIYPLFCPNCGAKFVYRASAKKKPRRPMKIMGDGDADFDIWKPNREHT